VDHYVIKTADQGGLFYGPWRLREWTFCLLRGIKKGTPEHAGVPQNHLSKLARGIVVIPLQVGKMDVKL
jgi:hypothetical protein